MEKRKYVTMKDIAESLGLSITSVSKALRNHPDISSSTRRKVQQAVGEMGYIHNAQASSLRQRRSNTIGVLASDLSNPFFIEVLNGLEVAAKERGYRLLLSNSEADEDLETMLIQTMMEKRIEGLVFSPVDIEQAKEKCKHIPNLVITGSALPDWEATYILTDEYNGAYQATSHLIEQGCKTIIMLANYIFYRTTQQAGLVSERLTGFKEALEAHGMPFQEDHVVVNKEYHRRKKDQQYHQRNRLEDGYTIMKEALKRIPNVDGVFCYNDLTAYGALKALHEEGIQVPQQVAVVGYDNLNLSEIVHPPLTTVHFDKFEMGYKAVNILIDRLEQPDLPNQQIRLKTSLRIRESSRRLF